MFTLNYKFLRLLYFEKIEDMERTDRQTDGPGATLNASAMDGCVQHVMPAAEAGTGIQVL